MIKQKRCFLFEHRARSQSIFKMLPLLDSLEDLQQSDLLSFCQILKMSL